MRTETDTRPMWHKSQVTINLNDNRANQNDDGKREAWISAKAPGVCVLKQRQDGTGLWNVTHLASGKQVVPDIRSLTVAKKAALAISALLDCTVDGAALAASVNESNRAALFQIRRDAALS